VTEKVSGSSASTLRRVAVIGGGITGLAAAQRLASRSDNTQIVVFESSQRLGGIIRTETADGFLMELGPDSFITNKPGAIQLCSEIGFRDQLIPTDSRFRRSLVLRKGKPVPVPDGFMLMAPTKPWAILTTPILSFAGRLRLLCEALVARRKIDNDDESLASFVRRRFGQQTLERLVQPLVGGIYTADPEKLSLKATLPRFMEMEQSHGSVIRATLAQQKQEPERAANGRDGSEESSGSGARYGMFATAAGGLSDMVAALEQNLRNSGRVDIQLGVKVTGINRATGSDPQWMLQLQHYAARPFDAVIVTLPTHSASRILGASISQELQAALGQIEYASSAIVVSGHQLSDFEHPMDAFGLVIPAIEGRRILAVSFSSRKFRDRAPEGQILLRTFVGGAMQPELLSHDDDTIAGIVNAELRSIFGMKAEPMFSEVIRYNHAMPQYNVGHLERVARITTLLKQSPGLHLAGSSYTGVGIPDSIASGWAAADNVIQNAGAEILREAQA
jgi:oxygen-dependent protoporphyrinogen oxidase